MIAAYFDEHSVQCSVLGIDPLLMGSMLLFTREIQIANTASTCIFPTSNLHRNGNNI